MREIRRLPAAAGDLAGSGISIAAGPGSREVRCEPSIGASTGERGGADPAPVAARASLHYRLVVRVLADESLLNTYTVDAAPAAMSAEWVRRLRYVGALCAVWAIPGAIAAFSLVVVAPGPGGEPVMSAGRAIAWQVSAWMTWAPWTALVIYLVRRMPFRPLVWPRAVLTHALLLPVVVSIQIGVAVMLERVAMGYGEEVPVSYHVREMFLRMLDFEVVIYMAVLAGGIALDYFRRYREGLFAAERLRTEMVQAQLLALRSQLNPHFLFNALNSVISLMDRDIPAAQRMVARIGELLRLSLGADESEVPLARELMLVRQYLEIERIRFGDRLTFVVDVPESLLDVPVPNLALQPLVENAIVHGVGPRPGPGRVTVQAERRGETLVLRVVDDGVGPHAAGDRAGHGIGVSNTRARLSAMYGDAAVFSLRPARDGGTVAEIRLPLEAAVTR